MNSPFGSRYALEWNVSLFSAERASEPTKSVFMHALSADGGDGGLAGVASGGRLCAAYLYCRRFWKMAKTQYPAVKRARPRTTFCMHAGCSASLQHLGLHERAQKMYHVYARICVYTPSNCKFFTYPRLISHHWWKMRANVFSSWKIWYKPIILNNYSIM